MSEVPKWFERKFDLSFPVHLYPNVRIRLQGTPARLEELIGTIPHDILTRKSGQSWSAQENVGHLLDLESLWLARVEDYLKGKELFPLLTLQIAKQRMLDTINGL